MKISVHIAIRHLFLLSVMTLHLSDGFCQKNPMFIHQVSSWSNDGEFSPDDKMLLTKNDGALSLWEVRTGNLLKVLAKSVDDYIDAHFSDDGQYIAAIGKAGEINVWNLANFSLFRSIHLSGNGKIFYKKIYFIPHSSLIVIETSNTYDACVYDYKNDSLLQVFKEHKNKITDVSISPNGQSIFTSDMDGKTFQWDPLNGKVLGRFNLYENPYSRGNIKNSISNDGKYLSLICYDRMKIFNLETKDTLCSVRFRRSEHSYDCGFSPNSNYLVFYNNNGVSQLKIDTREVKQIMYTSSVTPMENSQFFRFNPTSDQVFITSKEEQVVYYLETGKQKPVFTWDKNSKEVSSFTYSHNGKIFYSSMAVLSPENSETGGFSIHYSYKTIMGQSSTFSVLSTSDKRERFLNPDLTIKYILPDFRLLLSNGTIFDIRSQKIDTTYNGDDVVLLNNRSILCVIKDKRKRFFNLNNNEEIIYPVFKNPQALENDIFDAVLSEDLHYAFTYKNKIGMLWDIRKNNIVSKFRHLKWAGLQPDTSLGEIAHIKFSSDGSKLLFVDQYDQTRYEGDADTVRIFDIAKRKYIFGASANRNLTDIYISPDNKYLFIGQYLTDAFTPENSSTAFIIWDAKNKSKITNKLSYSGEYIDCVNDEKGRSVFVFLDQFKFAFGLWPFYEGVKSVITLPKTNTNKTQPVISSYVNEGANTGNIIYSTTDDSTRIVNYNTTKVINRFNFSGKILDYAEKRYLLMNDDGGYFIADIITGNKLFYISIDENNFLIKLNSGYFYSSSKKFWRSYTYTYKHTSIGLDQLDVKYNRPDKVLQFVGNTNISLIRLFYDVYATRLRKLKIDSNSFANDYNLPKATIVNKDAIEYEQKSNTVLLHIKGEDSLNNLIQYNVWINGVPFFGTRGIDISGLHTKTIDTTVKIPLSCGENKIEVSIKNASGLESYRIPLFVRYSCYGKSKVATLLN